MICRYENDKLILSLTGPVGCFGDVECGPEDRESFLSPL
jgi:hypothetical protein